jgi:hypothetical protein
MTENTRMAKINGKWQQVELVWGCCDYATVTINGTQYDVNIGLIETIEEYDYIVANSKKSQYNKTPVTTDETLVVDPDMIGTY